MGAGDGSIAGCDNTGGKQGIFQYTPRGTCISSGLQAGATFISEVGGVKNYTGNLEDVLACIGALGEAGCGFEHQFAAITRALGVDGLGGPPAENQGFLRPEAYLMVVLITNEDDCSAALGNGPNNRIPLFDTGANTNMASQLGPPSNFRCNEFGHTCPTGVTGAGSSVPHPDRNAPNLDMTAMVTYDGCNSNDTDGYLLSAFDTASKLKGLKNDPSQVLVTAITGPASPYTVTWQAPRTADTSCNTTGKPCPWPVIAHSCTATNNGSFADPGVRTTEFVNQFGSNGQLASICDADFGPPLEQLAAHLGGAIAGRCISEPIADDPSRAGYQPQCTAELHTLNGQNAFVDQALPSCAGNGGTPPCWSLSTDASGCQRPEVTLAAAPSSSTNVTYECAVCTMGGVVGQGCSDAGRMGDKVRRIPTFGNPCDVGVSVESGSTGVNIISVAPDCASGTCLLPADEKGSTTGPLCTSACTTSADCNGGFAGDPNDPNDHRCKTGFVCMVPTTVGDFCCQSMCVCRDFVYEPVGGFKTPTNCMGSSAGTCQSR
jgi:hypothetical protein